MRRSIDPGALPGLERYAGVIALINDAWRRFYPDSGHEFAVEVVAARDEEVAGSFDVFFPAPLEFILKLTYSRRSARIVSFSERAVL